LEKPHLTQSEAAAYLGVSEITLEQWRFKKTGPKYYKPSKIIYYMKEDLDAWVKGE